MQRQLKLRVHGGSSWTELAQKESLPRFVRALEAGRRRPFDWTIETLGDDDVRVGWQARTERPDRRYTMTLSAAADVDLSSVDWTLLVESGERAPATLRGGEWWVGAALAVAGYLVARQELGVVASLVGALALLAACVILPHLFSRRQRLDTEGLDVADEELLERVLRGVVGFSGFELVTTDWAEPDLDDLAV